MYHEEKVINNILHFRGSPDSEFRPYTLEQLTRKFINLEAEFVIINANQQRG